jgi:Mg2+ and Co2+ transporter CorA
VVTVRHGDSDVLGRVRSELDAGVSDLLTFFGPAAVLYRAADFIGDGYEETLDLINDDVDETEAQVFGPGNDDHAQQIYSASARHRRRAHVPGRATAAPERRSTKVSLGMLKGTREPPPTCRRAGREVQPIDRIRADLGRRPWTRSCR